jgi:hypothetical protein
MKRFLWFGMAAALAFCFCPSGASAQNAPRIFFTDLTSGPNTGGENNNGTILTVYGKRFGASQGSATVTVGSGTVAAYLAWSDTKVSVAIGPAATTGNVVVHASAGASNGVPFTVRSGNIHCVSTSGNDANAGSFPGACWRSIPFAHRAMGAGDITYIENGVQQTTEDDYSASVALLSAGTSGAPKALVAYPGAAVLVGSDSMGYGMRTPSVSGGPFSHWVIAGLTIKGGNGVDLVNVDDIRLVGDDISCVNGGGASACVHGEVSTNIVVYGDNVHDSGLHCGSECKLYHGIYFTTNSNHIDVGWSIVSPNGGGCRGIQFNSTGASPQFDLHIHDNLIHDVVCDGINFATVDPSKGTVEAYNNIVYRAGTGPDPSGQESNYTCIVSLGAIESGPAGKGQVKIYNNTLFDCNSHGGGASTGGAIGSFDSGAGLSVVAQNNLVYLKSGENYLQTGSGSVYLCDHNLWFGGGAAPSACTSNLSADPLFVNLGGLDFHLTASSPTIKSGVSTGIATDYDGITRPGSGAFDIGALQFAGASTPLPNPPSVPKLTVK